MYKSQSPQVQPKAIELVAGYGVFLTQKQLDMAVDGAKNSPTRLIRNLMSVFFTPETLATSSACGTRKHKALDGDIVQACIRKCIHNYAIAHFSKGAEHTLSVYKKNLCLPCNTCLHHLALYSSADFVRSQFEHVSKSTLVDCINDKCANYRRKQ